MTDLRRIQLIQCEMLEYFADVCEKNNIPYYLAQGTLLGAVRQGAFIAWDDDVDVLVPQHKINELLHAFEGNDRFFITNHKIEKYYPSTWTKIRKYNTSSIPVKYKNLPINWGICMDVFGYFGVSDFAPLRTVQVFLFKCARKLLYASMTQYDSNSGMVNSILEKIPVSIRNALYDFVTGIIGINKAKNTKNVFVTCKGGHVINRSCIEGENKTLEFESRSYSVPAKYKEYLCKMFGEDYMIPPPENQRGGHDLRMGEIIWDCDKGYENYNTWQDVPRL